MAAKDDKKEKPIANIPTFKTFVFSEGTRQEDIDQTVNEWVAEKTFEMKNPMPGKCFSNHKTGDIYYVLIYNTRMEVPEKYIKEHGK